MVSCQLCFEKCHCWLDYIDFHHSQPEIGAHCPNSKLNDVHYGMEHSFMLMHWTPVYGSKAFNVPVDSLVMCPSQCIHFLFGIDLSSRCLSPLSSIVVPSTYHVTFMVI